ncbi:MAG: hypothetical protein R3B47_04925 [Bacteroidia bacterium]
MKRLAHFQLVGRCSLCDGPFFRQPCGISLRSNLTCKPKVFSGNLTSEDFFTLKPKEIAARTGQKMNFFQRMALRMVQKKLKSRQQSSTSNDPSPEGKISLLLELISLSGLVLYYSLESIPRLFGIFISPLPIMIGAIIFGFGGFILALIARHKGDRSKIAKTGFVLGIILTVIFGFLAIAGLIWLEVDGKLASLTVKPTFRKTTIPFWSTSMHLPTGMTGLWVICHLIISRVEPTCSTHNANQRVRPTMRTNVFDPQCEPTCSTHNANQRVLLPNANHTVRRIQGEHVGSPRRYFINQIIALVRNDSDLIRHDRILHQSFNSIKTSHESLINLLFAFWYEPFGSCPEHQPNHPRHGPRCRYPGVTAQPYLSISKKEPTPMKTVIFTSKTSPSGDIRSMLILATNRASFPTWLSLGKEVVLSIEIDDRVGSTNRRSCY